VRGEDGTSPVMLFTENDTNVERLYGTTNAQPYVKDGINDAVVLGLRDAREHEAGSKAAAHLYAMVG
jgi:hypothetical protein